MSESKKGHWLALELGGQRFALPLALVERVVRAVEVIRLPHASPALPGVINVQGQVVPVLDTYVYFDLPKREVAPSDFLLLLKLSQASSVSPRSLAFLANRVLEVVQGEALQSSSDALALTDSMRIWKNEVIFLVDVEPLVQLLEHNAPSLMAYLSVVEAAGAVS